MQRDWEQTFEKLSLRAVDVLKVNWHLGVTAFGGPPVHFKIVTTPDSDNLGPTAYLDV